MAELRNKKGFETELLLSEGLSFKVHKMNITAIFTRLVARLYKNLRCSFYATADVAVRGKIYSICRPVTRI